MKSHTRNHKLVTITIPPDDHEKALDLLPYGKNGETRSFSALVLLALRRLPRKKK